MVHLRCHTYNARIKRLQSLRKSNSSGVQAGLQGILALYFLRVTTLIIDNEAYLSYNDVRLFVKPAKEKSGGYQWHVSKMTIS